jgi:hypothetical protein
MVKEAFRLKVLVAKHFDQRSNVPAAGGVAGSLQSGCPFGVRGEWLMSARASWPKLEVAGIFRRHGEAWRAANAGHLNLAQRRVMTAIEVCRTEAPGGHVERCQTVSTASSFIAFATTDC